MELSCRNGECGPEVSPSLSHVAPSPLPREEWVSGVVLR